jgi:hypothetical protein
MPDRAACARPAVAPTATALVSHRTYTSRRLTLASATTQASREVKKLLPEMCSGPVPTRTELASSTSTLPGLGYSCAASGASLFAE